MPVDALDHFNAVAKELGDHLERHALHHKPGCAGVPEAMGCNVTQSRTRHGHMKPCLDAFDVFVAILDHAVSRSDTDSDSHRRMKVRNHWHDCSPLVSGPSPEVYYTRHEIDLLPR